MQFIYVNIVIKKKKVMDTMMIIFISTLFQIRFVNHVEKNHLKIIYQ